MHRIMPEDPTGGKVMDALRIAADKVEIEGIYRKRKHWMKRRRPHRKHWIVSINKTKRGEK